MSHTPGPWMMKHNPEELVRDIRKDEASEFMRTMSEFLIRLHKVQMAIAKATGGPHGD